MAEVKRNLNRRCAPFSDLPAEKRDMDRVFDDSGDPRMGLGDRNLINAAVLDISPPAVDFCPEKDEIVVKAELQV
jgi:hypothetical protein